MKVVERSSIVAQMDLAINMAEFAKPKRQIAKFVLTLDEYQEFLTTMKKMVKEYRTIPVEMEQ